MSGFGGCKGKELGIEKEQQQETEQRPSMGHPGVHLGEFQVYREGKKDNEPLQVSSVLFMVLAFPSLSLLTLSFQRDS